MNRILLLGIVLLGTFLLVFRIDTLMMFIGDFAWFYLSARDIFLKGDFPLVGIPSSHPWLHQGPLWTYMLAPVLLISNFHPMSGGFLSVFLGVLTIVLIYKFGSEIFSKQFGLIASLLYSISPLVVIHARMPYHTSPIPLFSLVLFYCTFKWIRGNASYLPWVIFVLCVLFNFEISTIIYAGIISLLFLYGLLKKKKWVILNQKIILFSIGAFIVPMLPIIIYDFQNGFPYLIKFPLWIGYKFAILLNILQSKTQPHTYSEIFQFLFIALQRIVFGVQGYVALFLFGASGIYLVRMYTRNRKKEQGLLLLFLCIGFLGILVNRVPSDAHLPMMFIFIIFTVAYFIHFLFRKTRFLISFTILFVIVCSNMYFLISRNYLMLEKNGYGIPLQARLDVSRIIVDQAKGQKYQVIGKGEGSEFESYLMNYEYLTWWLGNPPTKSSTSLQFTITEKENTIRLEIKD